MAKGQSTFRQLGKIDGRKYYQMKGVDGIVSQSINQGMSNRVKNDAAYANTRLNNAEFGGAGSTAGAITRALSQKWRYLLVPFATGKLAKDVRSIMILDASGKWGQRGLVGTTWQKALAEKVSQYSKNPVADYSNLDIESNFSEDEGMEVLINTSAPLHNEKLEAIGCTGVRFVILGGIINMAKFNSTTGKYDGASVDFKQEPAHDLDFGESDGFTLSLPKIKVDSQDDNILYGGTVVMLPYKEVNGEKYIMQEHCSFAMVAAK